MKIKYKIYIVYFIFSILFFVFFFLYLNIIETITKFEGRIQYNFLYSMLSVVLSFFSISILILPITDYLIIRNNNIEKIVFYKLHPVFFLKRWKLKALIKKIKLNNNLDEYLMENKIPNEFYSNKHGIFTINEEGINYSNNLIPWDKIYNWFYFQSSGEGSYEEYILVKYYSKYEYPQKLKIDLENDIKNNGNMVLTSFVIYNLKFGKEESLI